MSNRESAVTVDVSQTFVTYPTGAAASAAVPAVKNVKLSLDPDASANLSARVFNGHAVQVHADGAVWDTVSNSYLQPGRDFNPGDVKRK